MRVRGSLCNYIGICHAVDPDGLAWISWQCGDASGTGVWDTNNRRFSDTRMQSIDSNLHSYLPELIGPNEVQQCQPCPWVPATLAPIHASVLHDKSWVHWLWYKLIGCCCFWGHKSISGSSAIKAIAANLQPAVAGNPCFKSAV